VRHGTSTVRVDIGQPAVDDGGAGGARDVRAALQCRQHRHFSADDDYPLTGDEQRFDDECRPDVVIDLDDERADIDGVNVHVVDDGTDHDDRQIRRVMPVEPGRRPR
jgi:hypothetical protein